MSIIFLALLAAQAVQIDNTQCVSAGSNEHSCDARGALTTGSTSKTGTEKGCGSAVQMVDDCASVRVDEDCGTPLTLGYLVAL